MGQNPRRQQSSYSLELVGVLSLQQKMKAKEENTKHDDEIII